MKDLTPNKAGLDLIEIASRQVILINDFKPKTITITPSYILAAPMT